jgi:hypothetical protein
MATIFEGDNDYQGAKSHQLADGMVLVQGLVEPTDVDFLVATDTVLFTCPTGYQGYVSHVACAVDTVTGVTTGTPVIQLGTNGTVDNIMASNTMLNFTGTSDPWHLPTAGLSAFFGVGDNISIRIITPFGGATVVDVSVVLTMVLFPI